MQSVSAGFTTAAGAAGRQVVDYVEVSWDGLGAFADARAATHWTNESAYLISHEGQLRLNAPGEDLVAPGDVGQATVYLSNETGRFSWQDPACPLAAYIGTAIGMTGKLIRIWTGFVVGGVAEYVCIFSGVVSAWRPDSGQAQVMLECRDRAYISLQDKRTTALVENQRPDEWIATLAGLAGLTAGEMILDAGMFEIPWCWLDDESLVEEIWETAAADNGTAYFDQLGKLRFESILHWMASPHDAVQWTFDEGDYQQPDPTNTIDDVATQIVADWAGRQPQAQTVIYTLDGLKVIPPGGTVSWTARFSWPIVTIATPIAQYGNPQDHKQDKEGDYAAISNGGAILTDKLTITISDVKAQQCTITVANSHTVSVAHLIYFQLQGIALAGRPAQQVKQDASPKPFAFERVRSIRGNPYVQTEQQARAFIGYLAAKHARIRPVTTLRGAPGVPQLELGDRVAYADKQALGVGNTKEGFVIGINWSASANAGFSQDLALLDTAALWEHADYFIIGTTALGHHGRCWY